MGIGHSLHECSLLCKFSKDKAKFGQDAQTLSLVRMLIKSAVIKAHDEEAWQQVEKLRSPVIEREQDCGWVELISPTLNPKP